MKCAVGKCKQSNSQGAAPSFYNFPKDEKQRKKWIKFCNRVKPINVMRDKVCGLHFRKEDFERNLQYELGFSKRRAPKLKPGAVPCLDSDVIVTGKKRTELQPPKEMESQIQIVYDNPSEFGSVIEVDNANSKEFETEIKTEIEVSDDDFESEIPIFQISKSNPYEFSVNPLEVEHENPNAFKTEIKTENEDSNEFVTEIKTEFDIPSEFESGIRTVIDLPNELEREIKVERKTPSEFVDECFEERAPMVIHIQEEPALLLTDIKEEQDAIVTNNKEDGRRMYIKILEIETDSLRQDNRTLKTSKIRADLTIKHLSRRVLQLQSQKANLEKALRRMFILSQIKKHRNAKRGNNSRPARSKDGSRN